MTRTIEMRLDDDVYAIVQAFANKWWEGDINEMVNDVLYSYWQNKGDFEFREVFDQALEDYRARR